jgi:ApaG protein
VKETGHSDTLTDGVRVRVAAQYLAEESDPEENRYVFAYRVVVLNEGEVPVKLLSRHWIVRDAQNHRRDVRGEGVIGRQPELAPGESFEYVSGSVLETPWGTMEGSYTFERAGGERFDAHIGRFFLAPNVAPLADLDARR